MIHFYADEQVFQLRHWKSQNTEPTGFYTTEAKLMAAKQVAHHASERNKAHNCLLQLAVMI